MKYLTIIVALVFLSGCSAVGYNWKVEDGEWKLTDVTYIKGIGSKSYEPGKRIEREEQIKIPNIIPSR